MSESEYVAPALTVAAVARRLGVAPATLRTWDRRYGLGPSGHTAGEHRRYTPTDLSRLVAMRRLTLAGVPPVEAARMATTAGAVPLADDMAEGLEPMEPYLAAVARQVTPTAVVDAALRSRSLEMRDLLTPPDGADLLTWWGELVEPARAAIAARTLLARPGEDPGALLDNVVLRVLRDRVAPLAVRHVAGRKVVLLLDGVAAPPRPVVHLVAAVLADARVDARVVVGPVDARRALELVEMTRPSAVVTVADGPGSDLSLVTALAEAHPDLLQYVRAGDDAAERLPLSRSVQRSRSVTGLLHEVLAVVG